MSDPVKKKPKKPNYKFSNDMDKKLGFSHQYRDSTIKEVIDTKDGFIDWAIRNMTGFSLKGKALVYYEENLPPSKEENN